MKKFRPQEFAKRYSMKLRRLGGRASNYNWQTSIPWYPVGMSKHRQGIVRRFNYLHYLACHAPKPVRARWRVAHDVYVSRYRRIL